MSILETKRFTAATSAFDIGIVEDEFAIQLGLHVVHLGAQQRQLGLAVYVDPDPVLHHLLIQFVFGFCVVQRIRHSIAASLADTNFQAGLQAKGTWE